MQLTAEPTAAANLGLPCSAGQLLVDVLALHLVIATCATSLSGVATCRQNIQSSRSDQQQAPADTLHSAHTIAQAWKHTCQETGLPHMVEGFARPLLSMPPVLHSTYAVLPCTGRYTTMHEHVQMSHACPHATPDTLTPPDTTLAEPACALRLRGTLALSCASISSCTSLSGGQAWSHQKKQKSSCLMGTRPCSLALPSGFFLGSLELWSRDWSTRPVICKAWRHSPWLQRCGHRIPRAQWHGVKCVKAQLVCKGKHWQDGVMGL
jgi:hypothetical protein